MKPLLVGEANPYGKDPRYALFPHPKSSAGYRLARLILAMPSRDAYLERFDRVNLCPQKWSAPVARLNAQSILATEREHIVLLGRKVSEAFGYGGQAPFVVLRPTELRWVTYGIGTTTGAYSPTGRVIAILPHPSGLCRIWNETGAFERARTVLMEAGIL